MTAFGVQPGKKTGQVGLATRVVRRVGLAFGLILAVVLVLKLFRVGTPPMPVFTGNSPPAIERKLVPTEDNVMVVYQRAAPILLQDRGTSWGEIEDSPDFLKRYEPALEYLSAGARSKRTGFSLGVPHSTDVLSPMFAIGRRAMSRDLENGRPGDACRRAEELACLAGHYSASRDFVWFEDGLWELTSLGLGQPDFPPGPDGKFTVSENPVLGLQVLPQLPTSGLQSLLQRFNY